MKIKITRDPYEYYDYLYEKNYINLRKNSITCFIGCNGSGKTTLLNSIKNRLMKECVVKVIKKDFYSGMVDNLVRVLSGEEEKRPDLYLIEFNKRTDITNNYNDHFFNSFEQNYSSTGEGVAIRFGKYASLIGGAISKLHDCKLMIMFDDCDAGTDISMISEIKGILDLIVKDCKERNIEYYIMLTSNSFEMARGMNCVSVHDFSKHKFTDYEDYKSFVLDSRIKKNKRIEEAKNNEESISKCSDEG